jgi:hypothetical protein
MIEAQLVERNISQAEALLGFPLTVPVRPPAGDPEFGLDRHVECPHLGLAILIDERDIVTCVQFVNDGVMETYRRYAGDLPNGLSFDSTRSDVREALGVPTESREGGPAFLGIKRRPWDWFNHEGRKLHFEYQDGCGAVRMVSVMRLPSKG